MRFASAWVRAHPVKTLIALLAALIVLGLATGHIRVVTGHGSHRPHAPARHLIRPPAYASGREPGG